MLEQHLVNGLMLGALYGLIAVAYTMVYGIVELVNFAFGEVFMFAAFFTVLLMGSQAVFFETTVGMPALPFVLALPLAVAGGAVLGVAIERIAYKPLRRAPRLAPLISAIAVSIFLQGLGQLLFGGAETPFPDPIGGSAIQLGTVRLQPLSLVILAVALAAMAILWLVVQRTPIGRAMRATAQDPDAAVLQGIDIDRVIVVTFLIGSAFAALAGVLYGANFRFAQPAMGFLPGLKGLIAAVLGGIGNIPGAFLGGMVLGMAESLGAGLIPGGAPYRDAIAFAVLGAMLWFRPQGLLGARLRERV